MAQGQTGQALMVENAMALIAKTPKTVGSEGE